jgi:transglutaminase/protease-like cytokinesis protein 3
MKLTAAILFVLFCYPTLAQSSGSVNWRVQSIDADAAQPLAQKLTAQCTNDMEKVKAIFGWITENIAYQVKPRYNRGGKSFSKYEIEDPSDTASVLKPLNERVADLVIRRKEAFCDGYARLFKTLCDFSGVKAEVITGYSRIVLDRNGQKFKSNHTWNAVCIDSTWRLLDVTWASGFITYSGGDFIRRYDNSYFLTPPQQFINDHYPEDLQWTLLPQPPSLKEFYASPFRQQGFVRSAITSYKPEKGVIDAAIGDTIKLELETSYRSATDPYAYEAPQISYWDTAFQSPTSSWVYIKPVFAGNGKISYRYPVQSTSVEYVNLVFNDHVLLRYKLNIAKPSPVAVVN